MVGLLVSNAIMPGKGKVGAPTTLMMGIYGTLVGLAVLSYFSEGLVISPLTFQVASVRPFLGVHSAFLPSFNAKINRERQ